MIPDRYQLTEVEGSYRQRTRRNVRDSDATLIVSITEEVTGGTIETRKYAEKVGKPWLHIWPDAPRRETLAAWLVSNRIVVINVAGPRASKEPAVGAFVHALLNEAAAVLGKG